MALGKGFQGKIWYEIETSYGSGVTPLTEKPIGEFVQDVRWGSGDRHKILRGFDTPVVKSLLEQTKEPTLHVEYLLQVGDTLVHDSAEHRSCCTLYSLAFIIQSNSCTDLSTAERSWFHVLGAKLKTLRVASSKNEPYTITCDYECSSIVTISEASIGTEPAELGGAVCGFNIAGSIVKGASGTVASVCNSIDFTIENQLTPYQNAGVLNKEHLIEGEMNITGTMDITLDNGGGVHWYNVNRNESFALQINTGGTGALRFDFAGCQFDNTEQDRGVSGEAVIENAPFTAVPSSCTSLITNVP